MTVSYKQPGVSEHFVSPLNAFHPDTFQGKKHGLCAC